MKLFNFINEKKGSISIFMAIILFSMFTLSSVLVEGSRIRNAKAIVQSASDSAAKSLLANYDKELKDRYGLFVLDETNIESLKSDYMDFFMTNLSSDLPENDSINKLFKDMSIQLGFDKEINNSFDLYGFENGESSINKVYSIIEPMVLRKQVAEFSKYRAAFSVGQFISIGNQISEEAKKNQVDMENIQDTLDSREDVEKIIRDYKDLSDDIKEAVNKYNYDCVSFINSISGINNKLNEYKTELEKLKEIYDNDKSNDTSLTENNQEQITSDNNNEVQENIENNNEKDIEDCKYKIQTILDVNEPNSLSNYYTKIDNFLTILLGHASNFAELIEKSEKLQIRINNAIREQENIKNNIKSGGNKETEEGIKEDAESAIKELESLKSNSEFLQKANSKVLNYMANIEEFNSNLDIAIDMGSDVKTQSGYQFPVNSQETKNVIDKVDELKESVNDIKDYTIDGTYNEYKNEEPSEEAANLFDLFKNNEDSYVKGNDESGKEQGELPEDIPSKVIDNYITSDKYLEKDNEYIKNEIDNYNTASMPEGDVSKGNNSESIKIDDFNNDDIDGSLNQINGFLDSIINMANSQTNVAMADLYIMGMFSSRLTNSCEYWNNVMQNRSKPTNVNYYDKLRDFEPEKNLRLKDKSDYIDSSYFHSEIEYIIKGGKSDKYNNNSIYAQIYAIRLANNLVAMYSNKEIRNLALKAASCTGTFAPLVQIAIMVFIAGMETYIDMYFIVNMGYKIPLIKTNENLNISIKNIDNIINSISSGRGFTPNNDSKGFMVDYETYLFFFLLLTNKDDKILRMADVIDLNMRQKDSSYKLAEHYTYIRCDTNVYMKPLLLGFEFAPENIRENDKYKIRTLNYQGY
ncbi:hypothetical protein B5E58_12825 [Tyzzerella sp. An114]|uniref:DUF5702 domain-containing protein n=1 Tax=Tyzzerella sp. An114 TaxID=1965545 RepID=UPI000B4388C3|nr:DUF5702 domain-containing protein [Tyzzerella sp. An114]OUQ55118.1 hypothetical protein B5E58_12825 [Tyzzerella sp. An114]